MKISLINLCIYKSPSTDIRSFIETLSKVIKQYKYNGGYTVLIVNMNINIVGDNLINNEYLDLLSVSGFASFININTRLKLNSGVLQTDIS